jgi:hypothetical protein
MANQVNIPVIQTQTPGLTQVQQNINKVFNNTYNQIVSLQDDISTIQALGDVIFSPLTLVQFQSVHNSDWIIANGQSCVGTAYEILTLNKTVPTITLSGATAFIKVN